MASTIVSRTQSLSESAAGRRTWTFSCWFKRNGISSSQELFGTDANGARSNNYNIIDLNASNQIDFAGYESGITFRKTTNRLFKDTNAWYHLVIAFDSTQSTADDRIKIYINGVRETSFGTSTNPAQDHQSKFFSSGKVHAFGRSSQTFDGVISHCHATEGTAYAPTVFGSTDATTGEWKINTSPSVSYGTNGFFLFKNDNAVTNQAGNSSGNFAVTAGTLTKTEDNPSNVFATLNPLFYSADITLSNGNTKAVEASNNWRSAYSNIGHSTGKFYAEAKITYQSGNEAYIGVAHEDHMNGTAAYGGSTSGPNSGGYDYIGYSNKSVGIYSNGQQHYPSTVQTTASFQSNGDIIGIAVDIPGNKFYLSKNGQWNNAAGNAWDSTTFDASVGAISWTSKWTSGQVFVGCSPNESTWEWNFGNGYFGTTAVSSAGTNASNIGIFEYDVPTGFTAWSTKGLNE